MTLGSTPEGLSEAEARARLERHGPNLLPQARGDSAWTLLGRQLKNPLIAVLVAASGVAFVADPHDGVKNGPVILAVVVLNTDIGFFQEYRASKAVQPSRGWSPSSPAPCGTGGRSRWPWPTWSPATWCPWPRSAGS